jgi:WD40 repeat protein
VAFSPDGTVLASASWDGDAKVWDVASGQERFTLPHLGAQGVRCVTFSPDGKTLASAGEGDMVVKLWDVATGHERFRFHEHTGPVNCVAFSPDGKTLASGGQDHTVRLWDAATGQRRALAHVDDVRSVAFAPDGKTLASASRDETVKLWDVDVGQEPVPLRGTTSWALSSDGKTLASSQGGYGQAPGRRHGAGAGGLRGTGGGAAGVCPRRRDLDRVRPGRDREGLGRRQRAGAGHLPGASVRSARVRAGRQAPGQGQLFFHPHDCR